MGTDYSEKERTFIAGLAEDSGRALDDWMTAVTEAKLSNRNDIIDWLRYQGFTFANASWLERIHHNGGRLIYADGEILPPVLPPSPPDQAPSVQAPPAMPAAAPPPFPPPARPLAADISELLAAAKGLRPLAELALKDIAEVVADVSLTAQGPLIVLNGPQPFLALLPGAKALRIYADFDGTDGARITRSEAAMKVASKAPPPFPSVLVLTDARLVDATFRALVAIAHARAHT